VACLPEDSDSEGSAGFRGPASVCGAAWIGLTEVGPASTAEVLTAEASTAEVSAGTVFVLALRLLFLGTAAVAEDDAGAETVS
jgi:hypothetical protein